MKINFLKTLLFLLPVTFFTLQSCEKERVIDVSEQNITKLEQEASEDNIKFDFYFNEMQITSNPLELQEDKSSKIKNVMVVLEKIEEGKKEKRISINSFDTDDAYIMWGEKKGIPVKEILLQQAELCKFIKDNNIEEKYEKTGKIPEEFFEFSNKLFGQNRPATAVIIYKNYYGGDSWAFLNTIPTLKHTAWDNEISRYYDTALYGGVAFYSGYWYKNPIGTLWNWGWQNIRFKGGLKYLNDKTSSLINH